MFVEIFYKDAEELSELGCHKVSCHFKALFSVIVTVIFVGSSKTRSEKPVHHIPNKVSLFEMALLSSAHMGQELLFKDVGGPSDSLFTVIVGSVSLPGDVV